jgi:tetratricopeptide (TPR) repeat protein
MFCSSCFVDNAEGLERCATCGEVLLPPLPGGSSRAAERPAPPAPARTRDQGAAEPAPAVSGTAPAAPAGTEPAERRSSPRLEIPVNLVIRQLAAEGRPAREERTIAENISRGGVRVMTTWTGLAEGEVLEVSEIGGDFETRATVRGHWQGKDQIPRLNLEFIDRKAPTRLVGSGEAPAAGDRRGSPVSPGSGAPSPAGGDAHVPAPTERTVPAGAAAGTETGRVSVASAAASAKGGGVGATLEEEADRQALRDEVLSTFQSLSTLSHYELLDLPRDADASLIRSAYNRRARRFHPDRATRDLSPLRDAFQAILVKLGEARDVLEDEGRRRYYDARLAPPTPAAGSPSRPPRPATPPAAPVPTAPPAPPTAAVPQAAGTAAEPPPHNTEADALEAERVIAATRKLFEAEKYWDAIQILDKAMPQTQSHKLKLTMRVIWARCTSKNPRWHRRAEEALIEIIKEDSRNVEAHFELGQIYALSGLTTRAQRMYRRVLEIDASHRGAATALNSILTTRRV